VALKPEAFRIFAMNFDELQNAWSKQSVTGPPVDVSQLCRELQNEVRQRSAKILRVIWLTAFVFLCSWATALAAHFGGIRTLTLFSLSTLVLGSGFFAVFLVLALRAYRRMRDEAVAMGSTLVESLTASLRAVEWQMRDCGLLAYGLAFTLIGQSGVSIFRYAIGDARGLAALANSVLTLLFASAAALTIWSYYRRKLIPRRNELTRELSELK
jgi:hypothetical protein